MDATLDPDSGAVLVGRAAGGGPLWRYEAGARRRPFVHPLATPAGRVLTRDAPDDHPWHHGLWFTVKFVNGENFWEEYDAYGVLRHDGPPRVLPTSGDGVRVAGTVHWIRPDRETVVLTEARVLEHVPLTADRYALDLRTTLTPAVDVTLDRTPFTTWGGYGGLAFRGRGDLVDTTLRLSDGTTGDRVLGARARWLDLTGTVDGATAGLAVLDAPGNPSAPVPWYASTRADTYGDEGWSNFVNAAFLWDGPLDVGAGEDLTFRYRVVVHDGALEPATLDALADDWAVAG